MSLKPCPTCAKPIAANAAACPHCGAKVSRFPWGAVILGGVLCLGAAAFAWATL